jgi:hypothetical protein
MSSLNCFNVTFAIGCEEDSSDPQSWRVDEIDWTAGVFLKFSGFFDKIDLIDLIWINWINRLIDLIWINWINRLIDLIGLIGSIKLIESLSDATVSRILVINTLRPPDSIFTCKDLGILRARMIATTLI